MDELVINYNQSKSNQVFCVIIGTYIVLFGLYGAIKLALGNLFDLDFYLNVIAIVLGLILILRVTLWKSKPILQLDSNSLFVRMPEEKTTYQSKWLNIKEIAFGISYLKILETDGKIYNVDISSLKYNDLKNVKSQIMEYCETKNIPYKND